MSLNRRRGRDKHDQHSRAKCPMNINRIQMLKSSIHRCIYLQSYSGSNTNTFQHSNININYIDAVNSNTYLLMMNSSHNQLRRCNVPPNHRPACSSISQQRCHPRAGHDSSGIRVNCRLIHSQGAQTANQHSWVSQAFNRQAKPTQSKAQPLHTSNQTTSFTAL